MFCSLHKNLFQVEYLPLPTTIPTLADEEVDEEHEEEEKKMMKRRNKTMMKHLRPLTHNNKHSSQRRDQR